MAGRGAEFECSRLLAKANLDRTAVPESMIFRSTLLVDFGEADHGPGEESRWPAQSVLRVPATLQPPFV
jgi:hypothetical protein